MQSALPCLGTILCTSGDADCGSKGSLLAPHPTPLQCTEPHSCSVVLRVEGCLWWLWAPQLVPTPNTWGRGQDSLGFPAGFSFWSLRAAFSPPEAPPPPARPSPCVQMPGERQGAPAPAKENQGLAPGQKRPEGFPGAADAIPQGRARSFSEVPLPGLSRGIPASRPAGSLSRTWLLALAPAGEGSPPPPLPGLPRNESLLRQGWSMCS